MRNILRAASLALALSVAGAAASAQPATTATPAAQARRADGRQRPGKHRKGARLLRGVKLTDAQKAQLKAARAQRSGQEKALREQLRAARHDAHTSRQRGDSAGAAAALARAKTVRSRLQPLREQDLGAVRAALTPAQRATFDKNVAARKQQREAHAAKRQAKRAGKAKKPANG